MMKIFKSQKPAVCGTAKRPIRRWLLPPKKQQAYRFYSTAHFHVYERCRSTNPATSLFPFMI